MADSVAQTVWQCPWWRVDEEHFTGADGRVRKWYSARRPNPETVHVLAITDCGQVPVIRQWRIPVQSWVWELPAGICDKPGEPLEETARRELLEETGYYAKTLHLMFRGTASPGLTNELYNAYVGLDVEQQNQGGGTGGEQLEVHSIHIRELFDFAVAAWQKGELVDSKFLAHAALVTQLVPAMPDRSKWWNSLLSGSPMA